MRSGRSPIGWPGQRPVLGFRSRSTPRRTPDPPPAPPRVKSDSGPQITGPQSRGPCCTAEWEGLNLNSSEKARCAPGATPSRARARARARAVAAASWTGGTCAASAPCCRLGPRAAGAAAGPGLVVVALSSRADNCRRSPAARSSSSALRGAKSSLRGLVAVEWALLSTAGALAAEDLPPPVPASRDAGCARSPVEVGGDRRWVCPSGRVRSHGHTGGTYYLLILVTWPAPTVRPPSRMVKRRPSSIATGWMSDTVISALSPGMIISVPSWRVTTPVTSVVRK
ncbi:hypothetical protein DC74_27 [Streptomyces noursei]|uniref:Uncharacterized protein n=1 Tax=Streptomyces noursei TaxID=1971 RepID=A0A059VT62_STRNR|nr:hypothetical protein DC74_27 [Streptomyces noursei]GCB88158.1 hypothetical protein SALB_00827 [Streptomyces noursei]